LFNIQFNIKSRDSFDNILGQRIYITDAKLAKARELFVFEAKVTDKVSETLSIIYWQLMKMSNKPRSRDIQPFHTTLAIAIIITITITIIIIITIKRVETGR